MKVKGVFFILIIILGCGLYLIMQSAKNPKFKTLTIADTQIKYEIAKSKKEIELGLSYRNDLPPGQGMLFVFPDKGFRSFWMHEMRFPLDIIWIADDKIVQIDKNVPIKTNGTWTVINPNSPINMVLEMKSGEAERLKLILGSKIYFN